MNCGYYEINNTVLYIESHDNYITRVKVVEEVNSENLCDEIIKFKLQLDEYFSGKRKTFEINYKLEQLPFRTKLYQYISKIKYGESDNIKNILKYMNLQKGVSVITRAMYDNPLVLIIPCHRINNHLRRLVAYSYSKEFREYLLVLEGTKS